MRLGWVQKFRKGTREIEKDDWGSGVGCSTMPGSEGRPDERGGAVTAVARSAEIGPFFQICNTGVGSHIEGFTGN